MELSLETLAAKEANFSTVLPIFKNEMFCFYANSYLSLRVFIQRFFLRLTLATNIKAKQKDSYLKNQRISVKKESAEE